MHRILFGGATLSQWTKKIDPSNQNRHRHPLSGEVEMRESPPHSKRRNGGRQRDSAAKSPEEKPQPQPSATGDAKETDSSGQLPARRRHARRTSLSDSILEGVKGMQEGLMKSMEGDRRRSTEGASGVTALVQASPVKMAETMVRTHTRASLRIQRAVYDHLRELMSKWFVRASLTSEVERSWLCLNT